MEKVGSAATRAELLHAAALEISQRGYSATSFSSVAARLGLTKGAFAYHFPTKGALAVGLMEEFGRAFTRAVEDAATIYPGKGLRTALHALRTIESRADTDPIISASFILMMDPQPPVEEIHENFEWWVSTFEEFLQNAQEMGQLRLAVPLQDAAEFLVISLLGLTTLSHRTLARSGEKDRIHLKLLFTAVGVVDVDAFIEEVLGGEENL